VTEVGKLARDRSMLLREGIAGVMSFYIEVDVREQAVELHPSYSANVSIVTNRVESSIAVPRRAVVHKSSGDYLWVKTDAGLSPRRVRLGPGDAFNVIVDRGLDSGDRVAVPSLAPSEKS
jgi:multidrug efflux pump subunit AcrA (membrane-fusion protein)